MSATLAAIDAVRLLCGDPYSETQILEDYDVQFFLDEHGGNRYEAAAGCADAIAARYASRVDVRAGILSSSDSQLSKQFRDLAKDLRARAGRLATAGAAPYAGGLTVAGKQTRQENDGLVRPAFARDAMTGCEEDERC